MTRGARLRKAARDGMLALLGLAALGLAAFFHWHEPGERPVYLRMTAGSPQGARQRIAEVLRREAAQSDIFLQIEPTAGSEEALRLLEEGRLDVALVQGGLDPGDRPELRQAAALHVEPLHLLVKAEIHRDIARNLADLQGKAVSLGEVGSGTHRLASEVLAFAGLRPGRAGEPGAFIERDLSYAELGRADGRDGLPDAVFMVSTLPSPVARRLVKAHGFRLVPLPFHEAFTLGALDQDTAPDGPGAESVARIDRRHVYDAIIPAFTYGVEPGVPPEAIHTLGTRLLLVARKDVSPRAVERLLEVAFGTPFAQAVRPPLDARFLDLPAELAWHDGTTAYIRRNAPVISGDVMDRIEKELSILGAGLGGLFFLVQWVRRRYRRLRDLGFEAYILRVAEVERRAMALERSATLDLAALLALQEELGRLKGEALEKFADGVLEGEELMSGFLAHVSDTRDYLTRLILHERDNLEEQAQLEGRGPQALWQEAVGGPADRKPSA